MILKNRSVLSALTLSFLFISSAGIQAETLGNTQTEATIETPSRSFAELEAEIDFSASVHKRAEGLADFFMWKHSAKKLEWDWGPAFFLYGLSKYMGHVSPEKQKHYAAYMADYHAAFNPVTGSRTLPRINWSDRCPSALSALRLKVDHQNSIGLAAAEKVSEYLHNAPRNAIGALDHLGKEIKRSRIYPNTIWVDSLVMYGIFAAQWGAYTKDEALLDFGASQPLIFASVLQDSESHLFRHVYNVKKKQFFPKKPGGFWLRGNGWALASIVEILDVLPEDHPRRAPLIALLQKTAEGALKFQKANGLWPTLMNHPRYYEETSGTAILAFAFAKGARLGYLDARFKAAGVKAMKGLDPFVREVFAKYSGKSLGYSMYGISWWTIAGPDWLYGAMPRRRDLPYGVGAYLLAATEY